MARRSGGGEPAPPPAPQLNIADFFEPVADRDCSIELVLPLVEAGESRRQTRGSKRPREEPKVVVLEAASQLLKSASEKWRVAMERWSEGEDKRMRMQCSDEGKVELYRHLLAFVHSLGKELPADPALLHQLLVLAREQAVEACVAACLQALLGQTSELPAPVCLALLSALDTGVSAHTAVQAAADALLMATRDRLCSLLSTEAAVRGDAAVQRALLELLGPLQEALNDGRLRRPLFAKLPFELLRDCVFADGRVNADTEATLLAAFAFWYNRQLSGMSLAQRRERAAAICSRLRLPSIPPSALHHYWRTFSFLRSFDPDGLILLRAISAAAEPALLDAWESAEDEAAEEDGSDGSLTAADFRAKCSSWWTPRQPALAGEPAPATFEVEVVQPAEGVTSASSSSSKLWGGLWWCIDLEDGEDGTFACFLMVSVSPRRDYPDSAKAPILCYSVQAEYRMEVLGHGRSKASRYYCATFQPSTGRGWGIHLKDSEGERVTWAAFWAEGSPWLAAPGRARIRFSLRAPE